MISCLHCPTLITVFLFFLLIQPDNAGIFSCTFPHVPPGFCWANVPWEISLCCNIDVGSTLPNKICYPSTLSEGVKVFWIVQNYQFLIQWVHISLMFYILNQFNAIICFVLPGVFISLINGVIIAVPRWKSMLMVKYEVRQFEFNPSGDKRQAKPGKS